MRHLKMRVCFSEGMDDFQPAKKVRRRIGREIRKGHLSELEAKQAVYGDVILAAFTRYWKPALARCLARKRQDKARGL